MIEIEQKMGKEGNRPLPDGWRWVKLSDICDFNPRRPFLNRSADTPTAFVPMSAVEEAGRGISRLEFRPFSRVQSGYTYFAEGDVLFAKITPCMQNGKHAIAENLSGGIGFGSTEFHVIRPTAEVISEWIHWFLLQPWILRRAEAYFTGAVGQQRVPQSYLENLRIPLPPLSEQHHIAAKLREQMVQMERARAAAEDQLKAAGELPAAYLRAIFDSSEAQQWPRKCIGEVAKIQSGYAFKSEGFVSDGIRLLRNVNVLQGFVSWKDKVCFPLDKRHEFKSYELSTGDIVLSLDRPVVNKGLKVAQLTSDDVPSLLLQRVGRFRLSESIDSNYLYALLNSATFISAITIHDQSLGVPHVSPSQVEAVELPFPALTEQRRIATILAEKTVAVERMRRALEERLMAINALPALLLRKAFSGEL